MTKRALAGRSELFADSLLLAPTVVPQEVIGFELFLCERRSTDSVTVVAQDGED